MIGFLDVHGCEARPANPLERLVTFAVRKIIVAPRADKTGAEELLEVGHAADAPDCAGVLSLANISAGFGSLRAFSTNMSP